MEVKIHSSWKGKLQDEFNQISFQALADFVKQEYGRVTIYPPPRQIFAAFDECPFENVKVVILGQDPYHGPGQANGLCFSVNDGIMKPPSLVNIYKEIESDMGKKMPSSGNLERWAHQGVFLLNAVLTVVAGQAASHQGKGWEEFTDAVIRRISDEKEHVVFILWGRYAREKSWMIDKTKHLVLEAAHPSPLSASNGFFGCKHFSQANEYLKKHGLTPIEW
ncbi:MAG: uracil-DNA glycosylase [Candidatus Peregrinibacteria bacterium]